MGGVVLTLAILLLTSPVAKPVTEQAVPSPPAIVAVDTIPDVSLSRGETASVTVSIHVADGYHVQANPASGEFLIPLEVRIDSVQGLTFGKAEYPEGVPYRLENSEDILQTYEGTFAVKVPITALKAGAFDVNGKVSYQACDSKRCLFPSSAPFVVKIIVEEKHSKGAGS